MCFCNTELPRQACVLNWVSRRGARSAVIARDEHYLCTRFCNARGYCAYACFGYKLYVDCRVGVCTFEVVYKLRKVFYRVYIMVRRGRNKTYAGGGVPCFCNLGINLVRRQLTALAGFCTLSHFYLNFFCAYKIFARNAETSRSDLLYCAVFIHSVCIGLKSWRVFAALARVWLAADGVHGNCKRFVCLFWEWAERHCAHFEAFDDWINALDLIYRQRLVCKFKAEKASDVVGTELFFEHTRIFFKHRIVAVSCCGLEHMDRSGVKQMLLLTAPHFVWAGAVERFVGVEPERVICLWVVGERVVLNVGEVDSADTAYGVGKVFVYYLFAYADCFKYLCAHVWLNCWNAHFWSDFYNSV